MVGIGIVIVFGAIIASMGFALFTYTQYETKYTWFLTLKQCLHNIKLTLAL